MGGRADLRPLLADLDRRLCAVPELAALPGRFLFALDDGRGDVLPLAHDLGVLAVDAGRVRLSAAGLVGSPIPLDEAAGALMDLAGRFLERRGTAWHVRELTEDRLLPGATRPMTDAIPLEYGRLTQNDGRTLLSLGVPLATLTGEQIRAVTQTATTEGSGTLIVTPWRGLLLPDLQQDVDDLTSTGLILDPESPWRGITACAGAPGCANASAATRPVAALLARRSSAAAGGKVHVIACPRRCGSPAGDHVEVLAGDVGFTVAGPDGVEIHCDETHLAEMVALSRNGS